MPEKNEPVCFVPTGKPATIEDYRIVELACDMHNLKGYRRLPPGWTADAATSLRALFIRAGHSVTDAEILAALFPPSEPEPPEWAMEAAGSSARFILPGGKCIDAQALARHLAAVYAKHAGGAK